MDKKTKGSWLVYQASKIQKMTNASSFENSSFAGKAGLLLSALTADSEQLHSMDKVNALAKSQNIHTKLELPTLIQSLEKQGLIDLGKSEINVLGVTSSSCLTHTYNIFESTEPTEIERLSIEICEEASQQPQILSEVKERYGDTYHLHKKDSDLLFEEIMSYGFVDYEKIDDTKELLFNGNLFRREEIAKTEKVVSSLSQIEMSKFHEFSIFLDSNACVTIDEAVKILGEKLFNKLASVGIYDISTVSNSSEKVQYVTKPSAFAKYSDNSMVDDAFDLAKMFVSSLTYGMTRSASHRGKIQSVKILLATMLNGQSIGPVSAIGEDYKVLEMNGVVSVYIGSKSGRKGYMMKLLKREIGELALEIFNSFDASQHSLENLPSAAINRYSGPEVNRMNYRKIEREVNPKSSHDLLMAIRTGGL